MLTAQWLFCFFVRRFMSTRQEPRRRFLLYHFENQTNELKCYSGSYRFAQFFGHSVRFIDHRDHLHQVFLQQQIIWKEEGRGGEMLVTVRKSHELQQQIATKSSTANKRPKLKQF